MVEKGTFPKALISLFGVLTFVSSTVYGSDLLVPQSFKAIGAPVTKAGHGDISAEPMFVSLEGGNLLIKKGLPAIDAGDPDGFSADIGANGDSYFPCLAKFSVFIKVEISSKPL